jgi:putative tricarboxylic transport membrane protein
MHRTIRSSFVSRGAAYLAGAIALLAVAAAPSAAPAAPYFQGKTISVLVGFGAGGGVDLNARILANYLGKFIPGNPTVIVKNMPGGSSTKMHNYLYEVAKGDGETIAYGPWFAVSQILEQPGIRFRYEGFTLLGAWNTGTYIMYARKDLVPGGIKDPVQILKAKDLKVGGQNPFNSFDLRMRLSLEMFGLPYVYVSGYRGSSDIRPAILKGEANIGIDSVSGWKSVVEPTMVEPGKVVPLWSFPDKDENGNYHQSDSAFGIPNIIDVYKRAFGKEPSGPKWELLDLVLTLTGTASQLLLGPPKMNEEAAAEIRKGFYAMATNKEFLADYQKRFGNEPVTVSKQATDKVMDLLRNIDPNLKALLKAHVESGMKQKS